MPTFPMSLQIQWKLLCKAESLYLKASGNERKLRRQEFIIRQNIFDSMYRKAERQYKMENLVKLEQVVTNDPKQFWSMLKRLGPRRKNDTPLEVYDEQGNVCDDIDYVLGKWKDNYESLFNFQWTPGTFDDEFLAACSNELPLLERTCVVREGLDDERSESEVARALMNAKLKKAVGIDNLPNEILRNVNTIEMLHVLFSKIFETGVTPSIWKISIIKPIPKNSLIDPRLPLQYRGISLLSTVYKIFSSILNVRITKCAEEQGLFADEQNGFRKERSCLDHIYSLCSIIRNRKICGKPTYAAFVDMEKAFDRVNRDLLFYKMLKLGIGGKVYQCIKDIYDGCKASINLNGHLTDAFATEYGVKQGDCLSPTLFSLFINDMANEIKSNCNGISLGNFDVHCLLYADDLVLLAETEEDLQCMLDTVLVWCRKWHMKINPKKSNVVHFRPQSYAKTSHEFKYGNEDILTVSRYKYLGIILDEFLDFNTTASILADSAGRALGNIYSKYKMNKGFGYDTYTKLYMSGVTPIMDYCSGVWGYNALDKLDTIQHRAIRLYLGVHKFAPNKAINADMGWISSRTRRHVNMLRLWNRLLDMEPQRLTRKIFEWDKDFKRGWCKNVCEILSTIRCSGFFDANWKVDLTMATSLLHDVECEKWKVDVLNVPKLRTYVLFKNSYKTEPYVSVLRKRRHRSMMALFRCGILALRVETGRFMSIPPEYRLCLLCDAPNTEDETHFLFHCPA